MKRLIMKNKLLYFVCPNCGRLRNPFKGYYQLCNQCEKEISNKIIQNQCKKLQEAILKSRPYSTKVGDAK